VRAQAHGCSTGLIPEDASCGRDSRQPKEWQTPGKNNANEQPSKGQSGRENLLDSTVDNHRLIDSWEASDQRRDLKHRSSRRCFSASGLVHLLFPPDSLRSLRLLGSTPTPRPGSLFHIGEETYLITLGYLFHWNYLPACSTGCSIRIAYQAADASHPSRAE